MTHITKHFSKIYLIHSNIMLLAITYKLNFITLVSEVARFLSLTHLHICLLCREIMPPPPKIDTLFISVFKSIHIHLKFNFFVFGLHSGFFFSIFGALFFRSSLFYAWLLLSLAFIIHQHTCLANYSLYQVMHTGLCLSLFILYSKSRVKCTLTTLS